MARPSGMTMTFKSKILFNHFPEYAVVTPRQTWYAVKKCGDDIVKDVQGGPHAAPLNKKPPFVDANGEQHPGALRRSYHAVRDLGAKTVTVENDPAIADYGPFVEFGTVKTPAQPHLIPATMAALDAFYARLKQIPAGESDDGVSFDSGLPYG